MKALYLFILILIINSCASTPQSNNIESRWPASLPPAFELTQTPFFPQTEHQCGPSALATILTFNGHSTTPTEISRQIYIPERKGSLQIEIIATARQKAMLPYVLKPDLVSLFHEVAGGNPVLILQNNGLEWYPKWHYAVVVGYNLYNRTIILRSGTTHRWITPFKVFERTWTRAENWAIVLPPVGNIPVTAEPSSYLETAYAFEETGKLNLARKAYRAATRKWPEDKNTWLLSGNIDLKLKNWKSATNDFLTVIQLDPSSITGWNNLAYALYYSGCQHQAEQSLQCGLKVSPKNINLRDSLNEIKADKPMMNASNLNLENNKTSCCPAIFCEGLIPRPD